jgi:hypothetical protein
MRPNDRGTLKVELRKYHSGSIYKMEGVRVVAGAPRNLKI